MSALAPLPPTEHALTRALLGDGSLPAPEQIRQLVRVVGAAPQVDMPVRHHFGPHLYIREILVPKGTVAVGKVHRHAHLAVMLHGDMTFLTKQGLQRIAGHCVMPLAPAYTQRAVLAHEDTVILNMHPTSIALPSEADLAALEAEVIAPFDEAEAIGGDELIREIVKHAEG
jgi:hypothetical protein